MAEGTKTIVTNRKARYEYHIEDRFEAGLMLTGTEVKSLRTGKANLQEAFCAAVGGEMFLQQCHIAPYSHGNLANHDPLRPRKLLLHKKEIEKMAKATQQKGYTIIPMRLYFKAGRAKLEIGLGKGKKLHDKRADIAGRDSKRRLDRIRKGGTED
ncbi:MAG: SsrA-binding protein [Rhodothermales bacterium]|jgi:SsrA-binding protein